MRWRQERRPDTVARFQTALHNCITAINLCDRASPGGWQLEASGDNDDDAAFVASHTDRDRMGQLHRINLAALHRHYPSADGRYCGWEVGREYPCPDVADLLDFYAPAAEISHSLLPEAN
jgi:hypothetical protein